MSRPSLPVGTTKKRPRKRKDRASETNQPMTRLAASVDVLDEGKRRILDAYFLSLDPVDAFQRCGQSLPTRKSYYGALYEMLRRPECMEYLKEKMQLRAAEAAVEERDLLATLNRFHRLSPWDLLDEVNDGTGSASRRHMVLKPKDQIHRDDARWIKKIKTKVTYRTALEVVNGAVVPCELRDVHQEVEFHSVLDVVDKLARMIGAYKDAQINSQPTIPAIVVIPQPAQDIETWEAQVKAVQQYSVR